MTQKKQPQNNQPHDQIERGSGNVFADLDLPEPGILLIKSHLILQIDQAIKTQKLTQTEAAKCMGIRQPKLSALLKGQLDNCTIDRLVRYLNRLGHDVEVTVKHRASLNH